MQLANEDDAPHPTPPHHAHLVVVEQFLPLVRTALQ